MTALDVFHHGSWELRTLLIAGEPWFVAGDVCAALGLANVSMALRSVDEDALSTAEVTDRLGRTQVVRTVSEPGLYELVFQSRRPEARQVRRWVTGEVLPTLRRTGTYTVEPAVKAPTTMVEALELALQQARQIVALEEQVAVLEPAARFADTLADAHGDWSVREAAQILDRDPTISTGERRLFATLRAIGWLDRTNQPYQGQINTGRLVCRLGHYRDERTDELVAYSQVRVTPKGLRALHERLGGTGALVALDTTGGAR
jgi:prophage antirepressor-like protein